MFEPFTSPGDLTGELTWGEFSYSRRRARTHIDHVGGADESKYSGSIKYTSEFFFISLYDYLTFIVSHITSTFPSSLYWGIDQSVVYGSGTNILRKTAGIVDTGAIKNVIQVSPTEHPSSGTTLIYLASEGYAAYVKATGSQLDHTVGLLAISPSNYLALESLFFNINGVRLQLYMLDPILNLGAGPF